MISSRECQTDKPKAGSRTENSSKTHWARGIRLLHFSTIPQQRTLSHRTAWKLITGGWSHDDTHADHSIHRHRGADRLVRDGRMGRQDDPGPEWRGLAAPRGPGGGRPQGCPAG